MIDVILKRFEEPDEVREMVKGSRVGAVTSCEELYRAARPRPPGGRVR
jgi:hypothetical protein